MRLRNLAGLLAVAAAPFTTGCAGMSKTAEGAGIGGAVGAGAGALIGNANHGKAGQGALVGGLIGAGVGGLIGNEEDQKDKRAMERRVRDAEARSPAAQPLTVDDVIRLAQARQSDPIIINQIRTTGSVYVLTADDLTRMSAGGVSDGVITEMQNRRPGTVRTVVPVRERVIYAPPPPVREEVILIAPPPPPPPPGFGVGVQIRR